MTGETLQRIRLANNRVNAAADAAGGKIAEAEALMTQAYVFVSAWISLSDDEAVREWAIGWHKFERGWGFAAQLDEKIIRLVDTPREVRLAAVNRLEDVAKAVAVKLEDLASRNGV